MKKTLALILAVISCTQIALAEGNLSPDKFMLYPVDPNAVDRETLIYEAKPGDEINERIILKSYMPEEKKITLYVTDGIREKNKSYSFKQQTEDRQMAKWISTDFNEVSLKPDEEKALNVRVKIPQDAPLGDYFGGIAAEKIEPGKPDSTGKMPTLNVAVRFILSVKLKITDTPQHIPKISEIPKTAAPTPYFYGSIGLFMGGIGYYLFTKRKEKKHPHA